MSMELGHLAQGNDYCITPTNTIDFIRHTDVPGSTKITHANFVADYRPLKPEPSRIECVIGGDRLDYLGDASSPTTNLSESKLLISSVISGSKRGAKFMTCDLNDYFLTSLMPNP